MTHELKQIVLAFTAAQEQGRPAVLATVVALEGSSYRRPGVCMLIFENGEMTGAVSGGCVEKEIRRQAISVFESAVPKIMTYDGRFRLGCEGILYILIEPFEPSKQTLDCFWDTIKSRETFEISRYFEKKEGKSEMYGSQLLTKTGSFSFRKDFEVNKDISVFKQKMPACFRLVIVGAEHDAVQLCKMAALTGWEVDMVVPPDEQKTIADFPGAREFIAVLPEVLETENIDGQTAIILMTHSFVKDLKFLLRLKHSKPAYLGLLGPVSRREKLLSQFVEHFPEVEDSFFDLLHGPAGLGIGAETPQEIAISVLSEIIAVIREEVPAPLKDKSGTIHSR